MQAQPAAYLAPQHNRRTQLQAALVDSTVALLFIVPTVFFSLESRGLRLWGALTLALLISGIYGVAALLDKPDPRTHQRSALAILIVAQICATQGLVLIAGLIPVGFFFLLTIRHLFVIGGSRGGYIACALLSLLFGGQLLVAFGYSQFVLTSSLLWLVGLLVMLGRTQARRRERAYQAQREALIAELAEGQRQLRRYASQTEELAVARERNRIARDIHDSLGHYLTALNVQLEQALVQLEHRPQDASHTISATRQLARAALQDVRRSVKTLRSADEPFSLQTSLQRLLSEVRASGLDVTLTISGDPNRVSAQTLLSLYRVAQEGLTNVRKHAAVAAASLELVVGEIDTRLTVTDQGRGFDPDRLPPTEGGAGVVGMRERLALLGGTLSLESAPGAGTRLIATAPNRPYGEQL